MSDGNAEVLDYLRESFARLHLRFDKVERQLQEHLDRIGRLETAMVGLRREIADVYAQTIATSHALDGLAARFDRIERRLDLVGTP